MPKKIADELRRRRLQLRLTQAEVARLVGKTRAYISAVESGGVTWEPKAEVLVAWSKALGWEPDHILRRLGRVEDNVVPAGALPDDLAQVVKLAVAQGVRDGIEAVLHELRDAEPAATGEAPPEQRPSRLA